MVCVSLGAFAKLRKGATSSVTSACPRGIHRLPLDGFSRNSTFEYFAKICPPKTEVSLKSDKNNGYFM